MGKQPYLFHQILHIPFAQQTRWRNGSPVSRNRWREAFEVIGFLVNRRATDNVFAAMNISQSVDKGIVVAALDEPDLSRGRGICTAEQLRRGCFYLRFRRYAGKWKCH